jgi:lipoprotein-releasing system ATP-binding protein
MNNIVCKNIFKSFKHESEDMPVLDNINLSISKADRLAITGASGAGKSTLLQLLAGLDKPSQGNIFIDDIDLHSIKPIEQSKIRLNSFGFVYQFHHLLEDLNVYENILIPQQLKYGSDLNKSANKVIRLLDQLGLSSRSKHLPWKLSGGEKQRVAIARAIVNNPSFLFLDEPTGNLDDENSNLVQDLILQIANEHDIALILSTHDINFANKMNKVYKIDNRNIKEV